MMRSCRSAGNLVKFGTPLLVGASTVGIVLFLFRRWLRKKRAENGVVVCKCHPRISDKVVVLTGATSGIGYQVALMAAQQRATVLFGARDAKRGEEIAKEIRKKSDNERVYSLYLDLNDLSSCRDFCREILENEPVIDILVNNAAVFNQKPEKTKDGFERTWQTNYLGCVVITENLLSNVGSGVSERAVVIFVSSEARLMLHPKDVMNVQQTKCIPEIRSMEEAIHHYASTKLALWMYATYHAFSMNPSRHYAVVSVDPGTVWTNIYRDSWLDLPGIYTRLRCSLLMRSPQEGAQTIMHCMNYPNIQNGLLFKDCREFSVPSRSVIEYSPSFVAQTHKLIHGFLPDDCEVREDISLCDDVSFDENDNRNSVPQCS